MRKEFYIPSSDGVSKIHCVWWKPEKEPVAVLQITHGMMEHILRYDEFATVLMNQRIAVIGHDHLGHGKSCDREKLGYFSEKRGHLFLIKDIHRVEQTVKRCYPHQPHFILGHSMGSFLLRRYLTLYGKQVDGAIIMGTGNQPLPLVVAGKALTGLIGCLLGSGYRSRLMHEMVLGRFSRPFRPNRTANDWLSEVEEKVDGFINDPCCNFCFTCSAYKDFFNVLLDLKLKRQFKRIPKQLPILVTSGAKDPVGDFGKGVLGAYFQLIRLGIEDVQLKLYPHARHEIINASNRQEVYHDIVSWMISHISVTGKR